MLHKDGIYGTPENAMKLAAAVGKQYYSISEVELINGQSWILKDKAHPELVGSLSHWSKALEIGVQRIYPEDRAKLLRELSLAALGQMLDRGEDERRFEARILSDGTPRWIEVEVSVLSHREKKLLVAIRNNDERRLLQQIVKLYVYRNCDYFIYLDARNDRYEMLWCLDSERALPPRRSEHYTADFIAYIDTYVAREDREEMKAVIRPEHILSTLGLEHEHTVLYGLDDPRRGYTRKRLQYLYYDETAQTVLLSRTDVTDIYFDTKRQNEALREAQHLARTDPLTGLYNHQAVSTVIQEALSVPGAKGALLFIDLDNFKGVNDIQGHPEGDAVLRHVAGAIRGAVRNTDPVGRVGGDEFVAFLSGLSGRGEIAQCVRRLCQAISRYPNPALDITCSIGIAVCPDDDRSYGGLLRKADSAMYHVKGSGKNSFFFWQGTGTETGRYGRGK